MGATPSYSLPYPELDNPDDVPTDMRELALAVEALPPLGYWTKDGAGLHAAGTVNAGQFAATGPLTVVAPAANAAVQSFQGGDANVRHYTLVNGTHAWGDGVAAPDVTLYRSQLQMLATNGHLQIALNLFVGAGSIYFGSANDTILYRVAANQLRTDGLLSIGPKLMLNGNDGGIYFGSDVGTVLYRSGAAAPGLVVNGTFAAGSFGTFSGGANQVIVGDLGALGYSGAGFLFGNAQDTSLYRSAANALATAGSFLALGMLHAGTGGTGGGAGAYMHGGDATYSGGNNWMAGYWAANMRYDADGTWRNVAHGGNNGWAMVAGIGAGAGGLDFYVDTATGAVDRSYTPAQMAARRLLTLDGNGTLGFYAPGGAGVDTTLHRKAAGVLGSDQSFRNGLDVAANTDAAGAWTANTVVIGHTGNGYGPYVTFGAAADVSLYRASANVLATSGELIVGGVRLFLGQTGSASFQYQGAKSGVAAGRVVVWADLGFGVDNTTPGWAIDAGSSIHAGAFPVSSDARLKKNVVQIDDALGRLLAIKGVRFDWDQDHGTGRTYPEGRQIGVIAQDVVAVFPELISEWVVNDGQPKAGESRYAVDYDRIIPVMIEAIREQQQQIDALTRRA